MIHNLSVYYNSSRKILFVVAILMIALNGSGAEADIVRPFESSSKYKAKNKIDTLVRATLREKGIEPVNLCSDEIFIRRVYLDVNGTLPEP